MDITDQVKKLVKKYPNDKTLGKEIRLLVHNIISDNVMTDDKKTYVYESPDGGDTVYRRESGKDERVLVKKD